MPIDLSAPRRVLQRALGGLRVSCTTIVHLIHQVTGEIFTMPNKLASEELLAAPLPTLIKNLGLAVAEANKELRAGTGDMRFTIPSAEIELKVAISIATETQAGGTLGGTISVFSVNASYSKTYNFKEDASSSIKLTLAAVPA
jgi:hypothetical protein